MRFDLGHGNALSKAGFSFELDKASVKMPNGMVMAARDPVMPPSDPELVKAAEAALCVMGLGVNCFLVTNVYGVVREVPYGAPLSVWHQTFAELLKQAMEYEPC
jgi:hypothetical protein